MGSILLHRPEVLIAFIILISHFEFYAKAYPQLTSTPNLNGTNLVCSPNLAEKRYLAKHQI
jgi:hypothetical protein